MLHWPKPNRASLCANAATRRVGWECRLPDNTMTERLNSSRKRLPRFHVPPPQHRAAPCHQWPTSKESRHPYLQIPHHRSRGQDHSWNQGIARVRGLGGALLLAQKCCQFRIADADATFLVENHMWTDHILWHWPTSAEMPDVSSCTAWVAAYYGGVPLPHVHKFRREGAWKIRGSTEHHIFGTVPYADWSSPDWHHGHPLRRS